MLSKIYNAASKELLSGTQLKLILDYKQFNHIILSIFTAAFSLLMNDKGFAVTPFTVPVVKEITIPTNSTTTPANVPIVKDVAAPTSFAGIVKPLLQAVVNISTTSDAADRRIPNAPVEELFRHFFEEIPGIRPPQSRKAASLGSGFIISQKNNEAYIVTCNHVIADADEIKVILHDEDTEYKAEIVGRDRRTDLALLKIKIDRKLTAVEWGASSEIRVGDWTIAIGNPFGLSSTVTTGIISSLARNIGDNNGIMTDYIDGYIQTDASINMGNSGGPMFSIDGKVIAISTAIFSPNGGNIGIGFGIPSDLAKGVINQLMSMGRTQRGWLGVKIQQVTQEVAETLGLKKPAGALVGDISFKSPAETAGIKTGDVILKFNGVDIKESRHLPRIVGESPIGKDVPIIVWRDGKEVTSSIRIGEFETAEAEGLIRNDNDDQHDGIAKKQKVLGLVTQEINANMRERHKITSDQGIIIGYVDPQSEAADKGLRAGDIILEAIVQTKKLKMTKPSDFQGFVENARKDKKPLILLLISRRNSLRYISLSLTENKCNRPENDFIKDK